MCSTGAATKLTVHPAMIPAIPCPKLGKVLRSRCDEVKGMNLRSCGFAKTFSRSRRLYRVREPSILDKVMSSSIQIQ